MWLTSNSTHEERTNVSLHQINLFSLSASCLKHIFIRCLNNSQQNHFPACEKWSTVNWVCSLFEAKLVFVLLITVAVLQFLTQNANVRALLCNLLFFYIKKLCIATVHLHWKNIRIWFCSSERVVSWLSHQLPVLFYLFVSLCLQKN